MSLLWVAVGRWNTVAVKLLLDTEAVDVNRRGLHGQTPLFRAAAHGSEEIVQLLLSRGADVSLQDGDGITPLAIAVLSLPNIK